MLRYSQLLKYWGQSEISVGVFVNTIFRLFIFFFVFFIHLFFSVMIIY